LAFSPDEHILYIDDSRHQHVRAFDVLSDGSLANGRILIDMTADARGAADGMKVDTTGTLYVTGAGGTWIISPAGEHLGTIVTPELPENCAFGGPDYKTLFIAARTSIYSIRLKIAGVQ
jgi:gluconolactonase